MSIEDVEDRERVMNLLRMLAEKDFTQVAVIGRTGVGPLVYWTGDTYSAYGLGKTLLTAIERVMLGDEEPDSIPEDEMNPEPNTF